MLLFLACAQHADSDVSAPTGAPTQWWTWSYDCAQEADTSVETPALPTDAPLLSSATTLYVDGSGDLQMNVGGGLALQVAGGALTLCDEGDVGGTITLAW